ncbi:centriole, cilia and spindle-associated protein [Betta splendens]|uniref:Centriole, cilia and spindle-associated protein n=1 Tax=Betta splendens TaxID=158456 RepID=A0A6P7MUB2_BETSP|nr:centriole, cilia and spindle-associated protein [Betta splendens]
MVTKKARTEYMKRFKDPKWETFSKCYEDSLKYRLTRRVMEHSHKPWFWEGWDSGSESSGWSTPRLARNRVAPLSLPLHTSMEVKQTLEELEAGPGPKGSEDGGAAPAAEDAEAEASGGSAPNSSGPSDDRATDAGPADSASSDGEPAKPVQKRHHRRRSPRSETGLKDRSGDDKPPRAKSQPAISTREKENRRPSSRLDWTERQPEARRAPNANSHTSDACVQTRRQSAKRSSNPERRRARSADPDKLRRSQLTVADERWTTEYMRCFSARLR